MVGAGPTGIAVADGAVWVVNADDATITRIDAHTGELVGEPIAVGGQPVAVAIGAGAVWVADRWSGDADRPGVERIVGKPIAVEGSPLSLAVGEGAVWVANPFNSTVARIRT